MKKIIPLLSILIAAKFSFSQQFTKLTDILPASALEVGGTSWVDYDGDGDLDLFVFVFFPSSNNLSGTHYLFQNNCNGNFTRITALPDGVADGNGSMWLDIDNDEDVDFYSPQNAVYFNNGDGTFQKNTTLNIIAPGEKTRGHAFADIDNDGDLDLFLANDAAGDPSPNNDIIFFKNNGNGGYTQITAGIAVNDSTRSETGLFGDYDNDGDMDLFVPTIDIFFSATHLLYTNDGEGDFTKVTTVPVATDNGFAYGATWVDYDNDMDLDLLVVNTFGFPNRLYQNDGTGNFTDVATTAGLTINRANNDGHTLGDYDNDGDKDLFLSTFEGNLLYTNNGNGTFTFNTSEILSNDSIVESYAAEWADYDNDGDLDLFVPNAFGAPESFFYRNNGNANHWLNIKLKGRTSNAPAIGARIFVKATINGTPVWQMDEVNANLSSAQGGLAPLNRHFGLGDATVIDTLKIVWPRSHTTQVFTNVSPNRFIEITEGVNAIVEAKHCTPDVLPENPGIVKGKTFNDINNNCVFDAGDSPIANRVIQATPGPYFTSTDNDGNYEFRLAPDAYTISQATVQDDLWILQTCQSNSSYSVTVSAGDTAVGNDFSLTPLLILPCPDANINMSIVSSGIKKCGPNVVFSTPCPGLPHQYCFRISNNGINATPPNTVLQLTFPVGFNTVSATSPNGCAFTPGAFSTNTLTITITNPIVAGATCEVCVRVFVDILTPPPTSASPWNITATYSNTGATANQIVNGDFEAGNSGFSSPGYTSNCFFNSAASGRYCVSPNPFPVNTCCWTGADHTTGAGNFLFADGNAAATSVWCENIPVAMNTNYIFSGWFNNIVRPTGNLSDPNMQVLINGVPLLTTGPIPENPDNWINRANAWCSGTSTNANICIRSTSVVSGSSGGNDFGIDDIEFFESSAQATKQENSACSCDPNDKLVAPEGCGPQGNIARGEALTYKIRFENIGTGPAHNIIIRDPLDADLDIATLQILASSHRITHVEIIPDNTLIISFEGIELPGIQNEPDNNGFVVFSIIPKSNVTDGTQITNQAGIYFDANEVVQTNSTLNTIRTHPEPEASFTSSRSCADAMAFDFTYTGNTADNATFFWNFGPDATPSSSSNQNPSGISFSVPGVKIISLTVTRFGCTESVSDSIIVSAALCGNKKVFVCHKGKPICVNTSALAAHLAHGDCMGSCLNANGRISAEELLAEGNEMEINVSPNPFSASLKVAVASQKQETLSLEFYTALGQKIIALSREVNANDVYEINTGALPAGIYILKIHTATEDRFIKLVRAP